MNLYRVFPYDAAAAQGEPGHPFYVPHNAQGRLNNAEHYRTFYASAIPLGAIAEAFGRLGEWSARDMTDAKGRPYGLQTCRIDTQRILNLDDANVLLQQSLRPSQVVTRNRKITQAWALRIFAERDVDGVAWWSFYNPDWPSIGLWNIGNLISDEDPEVLTIFDARVRAAADAIGRLIR